MKKTRKKNRVSPLAASPSLGGALPQTPTPERAAKEDYVTQGKRRRRANTLKTLYKAQKIGDPEVQAAQRWLALWEMGMNGYCEPSPGQPENETYVTGNALTYRFSQAKALGKLGAFRRAEGLEAHRTLILMLAQSLPFVLLGARLYPTLSEERARKKASDACAEVLEKLAVFWGMKRKNEDNIKGPPLKENDAQNPGIEMENRS